MLGYNFITLFGGLIHELTAATAVSYSYKPTYNDIVTNYHEAPGRGNCCSVVPKISLHMFASPIFLTSQDMSRHSQMVRNVFQLSIVQNPLRWVM